ncbi:MAG: ABC transporter substrate-binding protein [Desulfamplus sp.]|nr:ABC transporter substrate-binding protein [Desulfamplus sp.]
MIFSSMIDCFALAVEDKEHLSNGSCCEITDAGSRKIKIKEPFKKIISMYGAHTENLFYLGLDTEIIGVTRNESFPKKAKLKPIFSYQDDPEKFLASGADLVLVRPMIERGYPDLIKRLEKFGIAVISLQPGTVDEMYDYWLALGTLTGKQIQAEIMVSEFKVQVAKYKTISNGRYHLAVGNPDQGVDGKVYQYGNSKKKMPRRVYFEAIHSKMKTFTPGAMALFALEVAGGVNVATDAKASRGTNIGNYGKEKILSHASEIDIFLAQNGVMNQISVEVIKNEPGFGIIKAVKNNEIYIIDEMIVSRPCFRLLQGIEKIGEILYKSKYD